MVNLSEHESRVFAVLVEKAHTVPGSYPMTVNSLISGCNQKSNRDPVVCYNESQILDALDGLREKGLVVEVHLIGSRVQKYRHDARESLGLRTPELALLSELILRGPQTLGELRSRAGRMYTFESTQMVADVLGGLMARAEPMVQLLPAGPGSRADKYMQLICPGLHPEPVCGGSTSSTSPRPEADDDDDDRLAQLEEEVGQLRRWVAALYRHQRLPVPDSLSDISDEPRYD